MEIIHTASYILVEYYGIAVIFFRDICVCHIGKARMSVQKVNLSLLCTVCICRTLCMFIDSTLCMRACVYVCMHKRVRVGYVHVCELYVHTQLVQMEVHISLLRKGCVRGGTSTLILLCHTYTCIYTYSARHHNLAIIDELVYWRALRTVTIAPTITTYHFVGNFLQNPNLPSKSAYGKPFARHGYLN